MLMCTIILLREVLEGLPLVVAANRDELYARPTSPPAAFRLEGGVRAFAGRDEIAGGSWMAVSERGMLVAITNQKQYEAPDRTLRSRGHVVLEALAAPNPDAIDDYLRGIDARDYNAFNLVYGDPHSLRVAYARREHREVEIEAVPAGVHVLPNDRIGSGSFPKVRWAEQHLDGMHASRWDEALPQLQRALADHTLPEIGDFEPAPEGSRFDDAMLRQLHAMCIHTPAYGTRSATIVALAGRGVRHYRHAEGAPCVTRFARLDGALGF
jgi:uncharacterized protein with NRDE domain